MTVKYFQIIDPIVEPNLKSSQRTLVIFINSIFLFVIVSFVFFNTSIICLYLSKVKSYMNMSRTFLYCFHIYKSLNGKIDFHIIK